MAITCIRDSGMEEEVFFLLFVCCLAPSAFPAALEPFQFTSRPHLHPEGGEHVVDAGSTWKIRWHFVGKWSLWEEFKAHPILDPILRMSSCL